ncbi:homoserine kinase [Candidatus Methylopumilus universalis]|jgi:homoserine kinase type II|uniref:Homoserine kinase n=1 Tax=Candidatus Methylopumilus universalis TaxID=2588536 RepID=A0AAX1EYQ9_9PROT|nr:homoserine kinase [Candidatus Methylopumilus universalis]MBP6151934.1 homoserine kinase [Candidatus Methylopumilus sp.]MCF8182574.1 homoserine kinase [Limnohabitans sp.]GDX54245.1 homoserine kinase [Methylophilaceae bacterium]MBP7855584.1 homoserine kinase [Candidatus Methylopumilus sp.]MBW0156208.1 homoserine kinase [Candidatus Methylopumilus sp.]
MSVYTSVNIEELKIWLQDYALDNLTDYQGIKSGITNTNYFLMTAHDRFVLTLFEKNTIEDLPYFVDLMAHLAKNSFLCPKPIFKNNGTALSILKNKPALIVTCLKGKELNKPEVKHCKAVGASLAELHMKSANFTAQHQNTRDLNWIKKTAETLFSELPQDESLLLREEILYQEKKNYKLPKSTIHGDLFRDNVLFLNDQVSGFIDFYYACTDYLILDVAIAVNDWCVNNDGSFDEARLNAFLDAYKKIRSFNDDEDQAWNDILRLASLRFWVSRLNDFYHIEEGELTFIKDPDHFKKILKQRISG